MNSSFLLIAILLPFAAGVLLFALKLKTYRVVCIYTGAATGLTSILSWAMILFGERASFPLFRFANGLLFTLSFDSLGRFFAGIISTLWPMTLLYAFEYMRDDGRKKLFFSFFTMAYGVTLGVAMAGNLFTMYCFYELLTLSTVPLVLHPNTREAVKAARTYFVYSLGGAAFAFAAMIFLISNGFGEDFTFGGLLNTYPYARPQFTLIFYTLGVLGFGVKAAMFPTCRWLPMASVAPTPVTALLHAVAVVKSGVFAIGRVVYYTYDANYLSGSFVQKVGLWFAAFTIVYGTVMAWKETHFKKRLAYSTVSNLSYIVFAFLLVTPAGLTAGLLHMMFHGLIKIALFFVAGAVMHQSGRIYVTELQGFGKAMPVSFGVFTIASLALVGVPPLCGFLSKYAIASAAVQAATPSAYLGIAALLISAVFTAFYLLTIVVRAYFPGADFSMESLRGVKEANAYMTLPLCILAVLIVVLGCFPGGLTDFIAGTLAGAFPALGGL